MTRNDITRMSAGLLRGVDALVIVATGLLAYVWREERIDVTAEYMVAIAAAALIATNVSTVARSRAGAWSRRRSRIGCWRWCCCCCSRR